MSKLYRFPESNMDIDPDLINECRVVKASDDCWIFVLVGDYMTYRREYKLKSIAVQHLMKYLECCNEN